MKYTIKNYNKKITLVSINGDIENDSEAKVLIDEISELIDNGKINICFDVSDTTYINSSGISIFIHAITKLNEINNSSAYLVVSDNTVRNVIELAGLDKLIKTFSSMEEFNKKQ